MGQMILTRSKLCFFILKATIKGPLKSAFYPSNHKRYECLVCSSVNSEDLSSK